MNVRLRVGIIASLLLIAILAYLPDWGVSSAGQSSSLQSVLGNCERGVLCVSFFDVGQGDATLIESPEGVQVLIDGGRDGGIVRELSSALGFFDRTIDYVIATHPDADHIGGLVDVLERYDIGAIILTENESDTEASEMLQQLIKEEGANIIIARKGQTYDLGDGAVLEILFPDRDVSKLESNTSSIVAELRYGESEFLFTGDSPKNIEEYLVATEGKRLDVDVLKVGHHGSRTSTSEMFLENVDPELAIISAGKDNQYGHPHVEVTDMLFNHHVPVLQTAQEGTVTLTSDGMHLSVK